VADRRTPLNAVGRSRGPNPLGGEFARSASMRVQCLLWDFGNTLCDELSLWRVSPEWMEVYRSFDDGLGAAWSLGDLDTPGFVAALAGHMTLTEAEILAHLKRSELFEFFPFTYSFFRQRHLPQAIVTVNPTAFSEIVVPAFALDEVTDAIVVSGEERTIDKGELCRRALERINGRLDPSRALLIDDKQSNLDAWAAHDGVGYLHTTDSAFQQDVAGGIDHLVRR
jgi:phosphoglycolate phosphatase-like HAD superfamily hydrolase